VAALDPYDLAAIAVILLGLAIVVRRRVPKAYGLGMIVLAVFGIQQISALSGHGDRIETLGFSVDAFARQGAFWTPITSMFTHAGFAHVFGNLFVLVTAGPALEDRIGPRKFLLIYFVAGAAALVAHTVLALATTIVLPSELAVGASGAIFGVLTTFAVRYPRERLPTILPVFIVFVLWIPAFIVLLIFLGLNVYYMLSSGTSVAWWGHFAGFLVGLPFAYTLPKMAPTMIAPQGSGRGLPDPDKLAPLATTRDLQRILERIRQFTPNERTQHDAHFALAWVDKFFEKATCDRGHAFTRQGMTATCVGGETSVEFGR
jgi:membrane associated rhomboid family serine protease